MFRNYWTTALRNLIRNKIYAAVNIGGLAIGLGAFLLIALFIDSEVGFDKHWKDAERLYRLEAVMTQPGLAPQKTSLSSGRMKPMMDKDFSGELDATARVMYRRMGIEYGELAARQSVFFSDSSFLDVFEIEMVEGEAGLAFADSRSVLISEDEAVRLFGNEPAIGKVITINHGRMGGFDYKIVGVMANLPQETHMDMSYLALLDEARYVDQPWVLENWYSHNIYTYLKVSEGTDVLKWQQSLPAFMDRNFDPSTSTGMNYDASVKASDLRQLSLMPVTDIYLYSNVQPQMKAGGDHVQIKVLIAIAAALLFIGIVNFTNLTNARALRRLKEIAIRKVTGATRRQLIIQFLGEAILVAFLGLMFALPFAELGVELFSDLIGKQVMVSTLYEPSRLALVFAIVLFTGCMGGIYPALVLSSKKPAAILGGSKGGPVSGQSVRFMLVILQFAVSIGLTVMTLIVLAQTKFVAERDIGIDPQNRYIMLGLHTQLGRSVGKTVVTELKALPGVVAVASSSRLVPLYGGHGPALEMQQPSGTVQVMGEQVVGSFNLLQVLDAKLLAGRFFSSDMRGDLVTMDEDGNSVRGAIITDYTARSLGFANYKDAIGSIVSNPRQDGGTETLNIIGVVADMNLRSARAESDNLVFKVIDDGPEILNLELSPDNQEATLAAIGEIWEKHLPSQPLNAGMMDEQFRGFYADEDQQARVFGYSAALSILVASVGLFGLASLTAETKTREIGVRKVHGASVWNIMKLMVWHFSKPVFMANLIAWPLAWYLSGEWLQGFVFRIDLTVFPFLMAGAAAVVVAWMTVGFHAYSVAHTNPVKALRHE